MPKIVDYPETDRVAENDVFCWTAHRARKALASWAWLLNWPVSSLLSTTATCSGVRTSAVA